MGKTFNAFTGREMGLIFRRIQGEMGVFQTYISQYWSASWEVTKPNHRKRYTVLISTTARSSGKYTAIFVTAPTSIPTSAPKSAPRKKYMALYASPQLPQDILYGITQYQAWVPCYNLTHKGGTGCGGFAYFSTVDDRMIGGRDPVFYFNWDIDRRSTIDLFHKETLI